ncbi:MAG: type II secretion system protein [Limnothrix sp.]
MRLLIATKQKETGFTLIEILVATIMLGVMAAIASPGMLAFVARSKVSSAHNQLQGGLQEMQREAIKRSQDCEITFPASGTTSSSQANDVLEVTSNCLVAGPLELEGVRIRHNLPDTDTDPDNTILDLFDFKGQTDTALSNDVAIVITQEDSDKFQKCIAISDGVGIIRSGFYTTNLSTVSISNCDPTS